MTVGKLLAIGSAVLLVTTAISIAAGEGGFNRAAFDDAMQDNSKAARVILGGLAMGDWAKAQAPAETIAKQAKQLRAMQPPQQAQRIAEFQADADSLGAHATRIAAAAKAMNGDLAAREFGAMVATCTKCHLVFRKAGS